MKNDNENLNGETKMDRDKIAVDFGITRQSLDLFEKFGNDAGNWAGMPLVDGNFRFTKADQGNLTDLKRKHLAETFDDNDTGIACTWFTFTDRGNDLLRVLQISIDW